MQLCSYAAILKRIEPRGRVRPARLNCAEHICPTESRANLQAYARCSFQIVILNFGRALPESVPVALPSRITKGGIDFWYQSQNSFQAESFSLQYAHWREFLFGDQIFRSDQIYLCRSKSRHSTRARCCGFERLSCIQSTDAKVLLSNMFVNSQIKKNVTNEKMRNSFDADLFCPFKQMQRGYDG